MSQLPPRPPLFLIGFQRSGTTMLRLMLNSHPRMAMPFESDFIPDTWRRLGEFGDLADPGNLRRLLDDIRRNRFVEKGALIPDPEAVLARQPRDFAALVDAIFSAWAQAHGKPRWGDKDPDHIASMDLLWRLFPGCQFVHIVRDGRDVALSMRNLDWGTRHLPRLAHRWACQTLAARRVGGVLGPHHYLEVSYEALVASPSTELRRICSFIGEPFEPAMLDYHRESERWIPASSLQYHRNSVQAPNPEKAGQWRTRMLASDAGIFDEYGGEALQEFGYERAHPASRLAHGARLAYYSFIARW